MITCQIKNKIATLTIDQPNKAVNLLDEVFLTELQNSITTALQDNGVIGIVLTSAKKDFIAGADLEKIQKAKEGNVVEALAQKMHQVTRLMEKGGKAIVAALNGSTLGGGYEIALGCHYRICLDKPSIKIGLPEVTLGLLPGGGGTQRLPRMIGLSGALPFLLEGKTISPQDSLKAGLVQELANSSDELLTKACAWIEKCADPIQPWDRKEFKYPGSQPHSPGASQIMLGAASNVRKKTFNNYPAPHFILQSVYEGSLVDIDTALKIEARYFNACAASPVSKAMTRTFFFNMQKANAGVARPAGIEKRKIERIGVLGAGMMGAGIAYSSAFAGMTVYLKDTSLEAAEKGKDYSRKILSDRVSKGRLSEGEKETILSRIHPVDHFKNFANVEMVIEAVFEDRALKDRVIKEAQALMPETAIFASNTSTLPISSLAQSSSSPHNFIGLHFFSPVDKMPLLEIIKGQQTDLKTLAYSLDYALQIKKTPIVVQDSRGFFTSRVFATYVLEGISCLADGYQPERVENAGKAVGMPVGPLTLCDEVSLGLLEHIQKQTQDDMRAPGYKATLNDQNLASHPANQIVNHLIHQHQRLGKKMKAGFYDYPDGAKKYIWPKLTELYPSKAEQPSLEEVKQRLLNIQVIESIRILEEGILSKPEDGDIGSILGWGFAAWTGGVFSYVDQIGAQELLSQCQVQFEKFGQRFEPPRLLIKMAKEGTKFYE